MPPERKLFAHDSDQINTLEETVKILQPTALLGKIALCVFFFEG